MKGNGGRSRVERDPFGLGARQKAVPVVSETLKRRGRDNGDKMVPDGATNVSIPSPETNARTMKFSPLESVL